MELFSNNEFSRINRLSPTDLLKGVVWATHKKRAHRAVRIRASCMAAICAGTRLRPGDCAAHQSVENSGAKMRITLKNESLKSTVGSKTPAVGGRHC